MNPATAASLITVVAACTALLLLLRFRPRLYWPITAAIACLAVVVIGSGRRHELPRADLGMALGLFLLGPLAVTLAVLRLPFLRRHPKLAVFAAPLAFTFGLAAWILVAVNLGYLSP